MEESYEIDWSPTPTALKSDAVEFIIDLMRRRCLHTVLELGGGLGLTATRLAESGADVVTVERDESRAAAIRDRTLRHGVASMVHVVLSDALSPTLCIEGSFDLILIDAAKSQYTRLFRRWSQQLSPAGVIVSDNMAFHGIVRDRTLSHNRSTKQLAKHLAEYARFLKWHVDFATHYYDVGDGLAVSECKGDFEPLLCFKRPLFEARRGSYFALEQGDALTFIKVLPCEVTEDQAREQACLLERFHEEAGCAITPIALWRVGKSFAIQVKEPPVTTLQFALNQAHTSSECTAIVKQLLSMQSRIARFDDESLPSYKETLKAMAGGDTKEAASVIRAIKRLPDVAGAALLCETLEELVVLKGGAVCPSGEGCLCSCPRELAVCDTWMSLYRDVSTTAARLYLVAAGVVEEQLAPFADVLRLLAPFNTHNSYHIQPLRNDDVPPHIRHDAKAQNDTV